MHWSFEFDEAGRFVRSSIGGGFEPDRLIGFFSGLFNQSYWRPGIPLLIDLSKLEVRPANSRDAQITRSIMAALKMRLGFGKLVLLCPDENGFEFGLRFSSVVGATIDREICVFQIETAAIDWITSLRREQWPVPGLRKQEVTFKDETITSGTVN